MKSPNSSVIFRELTAAIMTMSICACVYILRTVVFMSTNLSSAVMYYHAFPEMVEYIVAGILFYFSFGLLYCLLTRKKYNNK